MKLRLRIAAGIAVVGGVSLFLILHFGHQEQKVLANTRRQLRKQRFKIDLSEFDFSTSPESRRRAAALTNASPSTSGIGGVDYVRWFRLFQNAPGLMTPVGSNTALVVWRADQSQGNADDDFWKTCQELFDADRASFDAACIAALSGPIRFELVASQGSGMLLRHLPALKGVEQTLSFRGLLKLREGNKDEAWTNLLAAVRLVTAWEPEPAEVSHGTRFACAIIAFNTTWQTLQAGDWTDSQLAELQREWEAADFFRGLPETAAFTRAGLVEACQLEREQPTWAMPPGEMIKSPRFAWDNITDRFRQARYRKYGTYEDENALLLHYRDRELELRRAVQSSNWSEMRQLPGVTNFVPFRSKYVSRLGVMINMKQMSLGFMLLGQWLPARAAETEARRRLIVTAVALERYRGRHGYYPPSLRELVPELLATSPVDFMDGKPLRYRPTEDGHFVLYSTGLDCADDGGTMETVGQKPAPYPVSELGFKPAPDLVWPRPASVVEATTMAGNAERQRADELETAARQEAAELKQREASRRATVENLLAEEKARKEQLQKPGYKSTEPEATYQGQPLGKFIWNTNTSGKTPPALEEMLTVRQVITGEEPDIATFRLPIRYDVVTNIGELRLLVDVEPGEDSGQGGGGFQNCERATNGDCLLIWNTTYDPPGQHAVRAELRITDNKDNHTIEVKGPVAPFFSSNLCQFDPFYSTFDARGADLFARLPESNGTYSIVLKSPAGQPIRTFTGKTSNGVINVHWDLMDDQGKRYTNDSFESSFQITLPDSGRSQTMRGR
jgi:hypothetical protein